ncbi:putative membrane protein YgcG [Microbacterium resistens]|uniref:Membrane protein YgcG n=1 Tax=Microbacterium resistens TaxID=156977 RepID=A0ABU1SGD2_9MICO|nr:hypothetical protein [Microbacterium resistens]MDR6868650.1 putative membrane protein YgcG [Microbacterium resistens]
MRTRARIERKRMAGGAAALAVAAVLTLLSPAAASADDYPSWDDVLAAQGNEQATQTQVARIETALATAQAQSAAASRLALDTAGAATTVRAQADAAAARASTLAAQADQAQTAFEDARKNTAEIVSGRLRLEAASPLAIRLLTTTDPDGLLARLGTLDRLDTTWATIARAAQSSAAVASSLRTQAQDAERARTALAAEAEQKASAARDAAAKEAQAVSGLQGHIDTLYAQLAALKNTTADVERRFQIGQQIAEQERQRQEEERRRQEQAPPPAQPGGGSGDSGGGDSGGGDSGGGDSGGGNPGGGNGGGSTPDPGWGVIVDPGDAQAYARDRLGAYGWSSDQFECLRLLWNRESGWRANALNPDSGAYGIPQALPAEKMAAAGPDWRTNGRTQVDWGLGYIADRYASPCGAWQHSENTGWY